jgi:hypothetical protein
MPVMFDYRHGAGINTGEYIMKLFEVEFKRTQYVTLTIEAKDEVYAEKFGLDELKFNYYESEHDKWQLENISTLRKDVR